MEINMEKTRSLAAEFAYHNKLFWIKTNLAGHLPEKVHYKTWPLAAEFFISDFCKQKLASVGPNSSTHP